MPSSLEARRPQWLVLAGLSALVVLLFPGVVLRGQVFYERDVHLVWYSQVESFVRAVRGGSWPVWDPYVSFGHPMLANPNTQVLYPPTWVNLVLAPESAYVVLTLAHVAWAGLGLFRLARRLGMSEAASAVASAAWIASGPLLSLVNVWHHLAGASWIPWVFLAAENALASPSFRGAVLWGSALGAQLLAGSPDMSAFTGAAVVVFTLARLEWRQPLGAANRSRLAAAILALLFALGLSAAQLLPTLEATGRSMRWNIDPALRGNVGSLHPLVMLAKVLSPVPLGELPLDPVEGRALLDEGMPFLRSLYLGVPALALVLAALGGGSPGAASQRGFFAGLGAGATLFALGHNTWVYPVFVAVFPALRMLRYPSKAMVLVAFAWAVLAGLGFERWRKRDPGPSRSWLLGVSVPLAVATLLLAVAWGAARNPAALLGTLLLPEATLGRSWTEALAGSVRPLGAASLLGAAALVAGLVHRRPEATAAVVAVLAIADLALAGSRVNRTTSRAFYRYRPSLVDAVDQRDGSRLFVRSYPESEPLLGVENPYKIAGYPEGIDFEAGRALGARLALMPPVGAAWGLFASWEPDLLGLYPRHLAALVAAVREAEGTPRWRRWLELGAVRHVAALDERGLSDLTFVRDLPTPLVLPLRLYRVDGALPRAYVVGGARVADGEAGRRLLVDPTFDPSREVVLASGLPSPGGLPGTSQVTDLRADRVRLHARLSSPGYVVLVDTYDPGWRARIDGAEAPVLRANEAFRAVALPAGEHNIEMIYRPPSVLLGLAITAAAVGLGLLALARRAG